MAEQKKLYAEEKGVLPIEGQPPVEEVEEKEIKKEEEVTIEGWKPKTELGRKVKAREITDIKQILDAGLKIREPEIVDALLPNLSHDFILIGQAKGKFGGGKRRIMRQTQKKTREGNKPVFTTMAVIGNEDGYVGVGRGTAKETVPAREKAIRKAKLNIMQVGRGCGSWKCACGEPHSLPFEVEGRCASVRVKLIPAPKGTGLVVSDELKKVLRLAGYKDVWSKTFGQTRQRINFVEACIKALKKTITTKLRSGDTKLVKYGGIKS